MRIYTDKEELISEIKRDIIEMGFPISTYSMQNKVIDGVDEYQTKEITNYSFCLSDLDKIEEIMNYPEFEKAEKNKITQYFETHSRNDYLKFIKDYQVKESRYLPTFDLNIEGEIEDNWYNILRFRVVEDFQERISPNVNPGEAWKIRPRVREERLHDDSLYKYKTFDYTYSKRINLRDMLAEIKQHPTSRQYVFNIRDRDDRRYVNGKRRIPCSLSYQILIRPTGELRPDGTQQLAVNIIYNMRSCDFLTHFPIDIIQCTHLLEYITDYLNKEEYFKHYNDTKEEHTYKIGKLYYNCASLHIYKKDLIEDVF